MIRVQFAFHEKLSLLIYQSLCIKHDPVGIVKCIYLCLKADVTYIYMYVLTFASITENTAASLQGLKLNHLPETS